MVWFMQKRLVGKEKIEELGKCGVFESISEQSLYLIVHELVKEKKISKGTLLYAMASQSAFKDKFNINSKNLVRPKRSSLSMSKKDYDLVKELVDVFDSSKGLSHRIESSFPTESKGFYIIVKGKCEVRNPKGYVATAIKARDYFGESDYLGMMDYTFFGNVVAVEDCTLLYLSRESLAQIPEYDQIQMRENARRNKQRVVRLIFQCAHYHNLNPYDLNPQPMYLSLIHICRCRRIERCRSRWSPYH
eukprot:TRINITY_DN17704_c0_g1_i2.p1 TRINITY_DN17704_c0_g1~~TRINITY_DN17704_c0_g1_i2.p1  ORF type:complete len:247 (+),score=46.14 TRINITY_DN17704_c0_g1_i2:936-1676(+)